MKYPLLFSAIVLACCSSCNDGTTDSKTKTDTTGNKMIRIEERPFGEFEGKTVTEYTLINGKMQVGIINYGGTITRLIVPDKNDQSSDVVLGYESLAGFQQPGNPYFGALIGRYGNRIAKGKFTLDGKQYSLAGNDHGNSLHGGKKGFDKVYWNIEKLSDNSGLKLSYQSKDGEEGYPGKLDITVTYTLTEDQGLKIDYSATTDKATPVNLTNHAYFNLSGGKDSTILNHTLQIKAYKFTAVNATLIPTGVLPEVKGTPMDFTTEKMIGKDIAQVPGGFDHNWVLNKTSASLDHVATLSDSTSGRRMEVWTTEPGLQFYSGNFLDGSLKEGKGGAKYVKHAALCLETQHFPDSPNQPSFPTTILQPGQTYKQTTIYKFSTK